MVLVFAIIVALAVVSVATAVLCTYWAVDALLDSTVRRWRENREDDRIAAERALHKRPKRDLRRLPHP